ncbi:hypothetical protein PENSPDRAFT_734354 [Peniophora sp. CONT]|nr:hypothetical protein PENSPDRAFT_734354 [Peniophora sp. CONT]
MSEQPNTVGVSSGPPAQGVGGTTNASFKQLVIELKDCIGLPLSRQRTGRRRRYFIRIQSLDSGAKEKKSLQVKDFDKTGIVSWSNQKIYIECTGMSMLSVKVIEVHIFKEKAVRGVEVEAATLLGKDELSLPDISGKGHTDSVLRLAVTRVVEERQEHKYLSQTLPATVISGVNTTVSKITDVEPSVAALSSIATASWALIDKIEFVMNAVDRLSEIHPYASLAWSVIGVAYKVVKGQRDRDEKVDELISTLQTAYDTVIASKELPKMLPVQQQILASLIKQTTECGYFIIDYARKGFFLVGRHAIQGLGSTTDKTIDDYSKNIRDLQAAFSGQVAVGTQVLVKLALDKSDFILAAVELADMPRSKDVRYRPRKQCLPGTRTTLISRIMDWATLSEPDVPRTLLLTGLPGAGKSSIAHTVAHRLHGLSRLAASYCFDRNDLANRRPALLLPTLARAIADFHPPFRNALARSALGDIQSTTELDVQFEHFLLKPFKELDPLLVGPLVVLVDALDESASPKDRRRLLAVLSELLPKLPRNIRFILTSRPEDDVMDAFRDASRARVLSLSKDDDELLSDMTVYVASRLVDNDINKTPLPHFTVDDYRAIAAKAEGLFQWAFVVCSTITSSDFHLTETEMRENYEKLMSVTTGGDALDVVYGQILSQLFVNEDRKQAIFRRLLGRVLATFEPLSFQSVAKLLRLSADDISECQSVLRRLGALVTGAIEHDEPIRLLHSSFRDFLLDDNRSRQFHVDPSSHHARFACGCLDVLNKELCFNICDLESSYTLNKHVVDLQTKIQACIPDTLSYAARYWGAYLDVRLSSEQQDIARKLSKLLCTNFLFWLELLSILGAIKTTVSALDNATRLGKFDGLQDMIADCSRFVSLFGYPIANSAPHVYLSAYALCPTEVLMKRQYSQHSWHLAQLSGPAAMAWAKTVNVLHTSSRVRCVAFSPDGYHIVSGLSNGAVCIWNARTSELVGLPLQGHKMAVMSVSFSADGHYIVSGSRDASVASGSDDNTICIWDAKSGKMLGSPLKGHTERVTSVVFSHDGHHIASGSWDQTIRVWNAETGLPIGLPLESPDAGYVAAGSGRSIYLWNAETGALSDSVLGASGSEDATIHVWDMRSNSVSKSLTPGHADVVLCVAFSPDGQYIASGSMDKTIHIWNAHTGECIGSPFKGHAAKINSVSFSPDGPYLASGSHDTTVRIWDADTGASIGLPLEHSDWVQSIAYSPDGQCIVSGGHDCRISLWDARTGTLAEVPVLMHESAVNSIIFSPNGKHIASGTDGGYLHVWNATTGTAVYNSLHGHDGRIYSVGFSSDGSQIVSGSWDETICVWNAATGTPIGDPIKGHTDLVKSVAFSPDDHYIISGSDDRTVCIWDAKTHALVGMPLVGHLAWVLSIAVSSDGLIASGSNDKTVRVWSLHDFLQAKCFTFSPDRSQALQSYPSIPQYKPSEPSASTPFFRLMPDGWIKDTSVEPPRLLIWIPPEAREGLYMPYTKRVMGRAVHSLDLSNFVHGHRWTECWKQGPTQ